MEMILKAIFIFCVCFALISDARKLKIPNWISIVLVAAFIPYALLALTGTLILNHVLVALVAFSVGFLFFSLNWFGGGDVKFMTAAMLWAGPGHSVQLVILMSVFGAILAMILLMIRKYSIFLNGLAFEYPPLKTTKEWADDGVCPYGIAIGLAALLTAPSIFL